jgi:predicted ATPase with chaperone activity
MSNVLFDMAGINESEARELMFKVNESIDLTDFTPKEHRLIYSLAGADLLDSSTTRALVMLYAKEMLGDIV